MKYKIPQNQLRATMRWLSLGAILLILSLVTQRAHPHEQAEPVELVCGDTPIIRNQAIPDLPPTQYLVSDTYGWFDRSHFNTGQPEQVLRDVATAVASGGGVITIKQGVRNDIAGYTADYYVSGHLAENEITPAALGIYLDWSIRFETWQTQPPQGLFGPLSPFAVEDLPSQYIGFFARANNLSLEQLFACYLGPVRGSDQGPPDFISITDFPNSNQDQLKLLGIERLQNKSFMPLTETPDGWQQVSWPESLLMTSLPSSSLSWGFLADATWYLGEKTPALAVPKEHSATTRDKPTGEG